MDSKDFADVLDVLEAMLSVAPGERESEARRRLANQPEALAEVLASLPFLSSDPADDERFQALRIRHGDDLAGTVLADRYELGEVLARGGVGMIYTAHDRELDRRVAVKVLHPGFLSSGTARERFARESRSAAALEHENIARVYDSGAADGLQYCVMEYVAGGKSLSRHRCDPREAARLISAAARGLQHSHEAGVIHRDIKPGNILLTASGVPKVADFGLAYDERFAVDRLTRTGELAGTPYYMSPEQLARRKMPITAASDVYSLGAVLYELLANKPPHQGETSIEIFDRIRREVPCKFDKTVNADLATICFQAMRKQPEDRYSSAAAFADDLDRFLAGEAILARPEPLHRRVQRTLRRPAAVWALALVVALGGVAWAVDARVELREERALEEVREQERLEQRWKHIGELMELLPDDPIPE